MILLKPFMFFVCMSVLPALSWAMGLEDLVKREGLYYEKFSNTPFSGKTEGLVQGHFNAGKKHGSWNEYYSNGQLKEVGTFHFNQKEGEWLEYDEDGFLRSRSNYKNSLKHGSSESFYKGTKTSDGYYHKGLKHGVFNTYWEPEGTLHFRNTYDKGRKIGVHKRFRWNGSIIHSQEFIPNTNESIFTFYEDDGNVGFTGTLEDDYPHGDWQEYHNAILGGGLMHEAAYKNGKRVGIWKTFYPSGNIQCIKHYSDAGYITDVEVFDEKGLPVTPELGSTGCYGTRLWESYRD